MVAEMSRRPESRPSENTKRPDDSADRAERVRRLAGEGARLLSARRAGEAAVLLAQVRALDPGNVPAAINLGGAYILENKFAHAVPVLESAALVEPENAMIWSNLAAAYLGKLPLADRAHQDKAIEAYKRALTIDPYTPHVQYNLGLIYLERKDPALAVAHFRLALETDPHDRDAQLYLNKLSRPDGSTNDQSQTCES